MTKSELKRLQEVRRTALPKIVERVMVVMVNGDKYLCSEVQA